MTATTILAPDQIRLVRKRLNLSQEDFAVLFSTTNITVYRWEAGDAKPTGASKAILEAIHVKTTEKSDAELKRLMKGFVVTLGIVALLLLLFGAVMAMDGRTTSVIELSAK